MRECVEIERSIIKRFRKTIWSRFIKGVQEYSLINENDHVMVCISGGKDSFLLAKCIEELKKHGKFDFDVKFVVMNPGYKKENIDMIIQNAKLMNSDIDIFDSNIFEVSEMLDNKKPCYMCARMRRGFLYSKAQELGCNKIALGHHFDDVIETTLLSIFYGAEVKTMIPKLHSVNFEGIELIRPLYFVKEEDIISWVNFNDLKFINCACNFTKKIETDSELSKRKEIKELISKLKKNNRDVDYNIFKSLDNVNLNCALGYCIDGNKHSFLEEYDKKW